MIGGGDSSSGNGGGGRSSTKSSRVSSIFGEKRTKRIKKKSKRKKQKKRMFDGMGGYSSVTVGDDEEYGLDDEGDDTTYFGFTTPRPGAGPDPARGHIDHFAEFSNEIHRGNLYLPAANNLDAFFNRLYSYYYEGGISAMIASRITLILLMAFIAGFTLSVFVTLDWPRLLQCGKEAAAKAASSGGKPVHVQEIGSCDELAAFFATYGLYNPNFFQSMVLLLVLITIGFTCYKIAVGSSLP